MEKKRRNEETENEKKKQKTDSIVPDASHEPKFGREMTKGE